MCTYAFSLRILPPARAYGYYFLKKICQIYFVNYYQSKNHKQFYKIKKLLCKAIGKCQIKTPERALGSRLRFLTVRGRYKWIILAVWIAHVSFQFCYESMKKNYSVRTLTDEPPPSPTRVSTLLAGAPLPPLSVRTLWMTLFINFEIFSDSPKLIGTPNPPLQPRPSPPPPISRLLTFVFQKSLYNTYENLFNI